MIIARILIYMNTQAINLQAGNKFTRWTIINRAPNQSIRRMYLCKCDCGTIQEVASRALRNGSSKSCGCISREGVKSRMTLHGDSNVHSQYYYLHCIWIQMRQRTNNPNNPNYFNYGKRGIKVFEEWDEDYIKFKTWVLDNIGNRPEGYSLDRIDNNSNYQPGNIKWSTPTEQANNRRDYWMNR